MGAAATLVAALLGLLLASRLSLRLRRAAGIAERVSAGDLDARIDAGGHDEVATLGEAIDGMTDAVSHGSSTSGGSWPTSPTTCERR